MNASKKLMINGIVMYLRMIIVMVLTLYISRLAINYLGVDLYGLFSVITGVVVFGTVVTSVLEGAAQRFFSEALIKNKEEISTVIRVFIFINIVIAVVSVILVEIFGLWFINYKLVQSVIDIDTLYLVFNISILTYFISVISSPLLSIFISHGKVGMFSSISILEISIKLLLLFNISNIDGDKSIIYSMILFLGVFFSRIYACYLVKKNFKNYNLIPLFDLEKIRKIYKFVIWTLYGSLSAIINTQGTNVLINIFFGLTINASRAIAMQINSAITQIINSVQMALNPQIIKSYIEHDFKYLSKLIIINSKLSSYISIFIIVSLFGNVDYLLSFWIGDYPSYTSIFIYLMLCDIYVISFSSALTSVIQATGKIKKFQIVVGSALFLNLPLSYFLFKVYNEPSMVYYSSIFISCICFLLRLYFYYRLNISNIFGFIYDVVFKSIIVLFSSLVIKFYIDCEVIDFYSLVINFLISILIVIFSIIVFGFNREEREYFKKILKF